MLLKAQGIRRYSAPLEIKLLEAEKLIEENTYDNLKKKGDKEKNERQFSAAVTFYRKAMEIEPQQIELVGVVNSLSAFIKELSIPENRFQSDDYQGTINECERLLKLHKTEKNNYPELYFFEGKAYKVLAENNRTEANLQEKAIKNLDLAIASFPNFTQAIITRADVYANLQKKYFNAIADYDILTTNALDDTIVKPHYFETKAQWKKIIGNKDGAVDDYSKAIVLAPRDRLYIRRGEILFEMQKYADAGKDFSLAISLNPKDTNAYYLRGLTYARLHLAEDAGRDFATLRTLKAISGPRQIIIDSIANEYYANGRANFDKDPIKARKFYGEVLKIKPGNSDAYHGIAEVDFKMAEEDPAGSKSKSAIDKYALSIINNNNAIKSDPKFADAFYKRGLALEKIGKDSMATESLSETIEIDNNRNDAYTERGRLLARLGRYSEAAQNDVAALGSLTAQLALAQNKKDGIATALIIKYQLDMLWLCANAWFLDKKYENAIEMLDRFLNKQQNKVNAEAYYLRGMCYYNTHNYKASNQDLNEAVKLSQQTFRYYFYNAQTYYYDKNYKNAIKNLTAIPADSVSNYPVLKKLLGSCYAQNKDTYAIALENFAEYGKIPAAVNDSTFHVDYGTILLITGQDSAANTCLERALQMTKGPLYFKALFWKTCYLMKIGQFDQMESNLQNAFQKQHDISESDIKLAERLFGDALKKDDKINKKGRKDIYQDLKEHYVKRLNQFKETKVWLEN